MVTQDVVTQNLTAVESAPAAERPATRLRWLIAFVLFLAVLSAFFDRISVAVLFTNTEF